MQKMYHTQAPNRYQTSDQRTQQGVSQQHIPNQDPTRNHHLHQFQSYNPHANPNQRLNLLNKGHPNALEMKEAESIIHPDDEGAIGRDSELRNIGVSGRSQKKGNRVIGGHQGNATPGKVDHSRFSEKVRGQPKLRETMSKRLANNSGNDFKNRRKLEKHSLKSKLLGNQYRGKGNQLKSKIIRRSVNNRSIGGRKDMPKATGGHGGSKSYLDNQVPLSGRDEYRSHNEISAERFPYSHRGPKTMSNKMNMMKGNQDVKLYKNNPSIGKLL